MSCVNSTISGLRSWQIRSKIRMKANLNCHKQYVDFDWSPEELTERLTMLGLEVEGVHSIRC